MASYKVIQDIEAEDKLLGPLTLRQFIYAFVGGCLLFLTYFVASHGAPYLVIIFVPPAIVCVFFAFPWSHEQTTEVWALARIRFLFKPRRRIWDQSGIKELVTINVPKRLAEVYTDGLSQHEVRSRLKALANTIDSRGWAIKNAANPYPLVYASASDDRLVGMETLPQEVPSINTENYTDMLDTTTNNVAQKFDTMLTQNAKTHRQRLVSSLQSPPMPQNQPTTPTNQVTPVQPQVDQSQSWFTSQTPAQDNVPPMVIGQPTSSDDNQLPPEEEDALTEELKERAPGPAFEYAHLPTIQPLTGQPPQQVAPVTQVDDPQASATQQPIEPPQMTQTPDPAILELAGNDDLSVATIAREAEKRQDSDEVVISLR